MGCIFAIGALAIASLGLVAQAKPVITGVASEVVSSTSSLFAFEAVQLTDRVLVDLKVNDIQKLPLFAFREDPLPDPQNKGPLRDGCKVYPGDPEWPTYETWKLFDTLLGGALIKSVPEPAVCYEDTEWNVYNAPQCENLTTNWGDPFARDEHPLSIRAMLWQGLTCMPPDMNAEFLGNTPGCELGGFPAYVVKATNVAQIQLAVNFARSNNLRLVIKNTGHDFGAKSTGMGSLSIWTHYLKDSEYYDTFETDEYSGPAVKFGAGVQVYEANKFAKKHGITVVGGEGATVGLVGGYTQGGGHSPLTSIWGMAADQVLSLNIVTSDGRFIQADSKTNQDIFWAVRGGGGSTFGVVTSMVVKAYPKIKVTTLRYNMTTGGDFTKDKFWEAQKAYIDRYEGYANLGYYCYSRIRPVDGEIFNDATSWVAPNTTEEEFRASVAPMFEKWEALGVPFEPIIKEYDDYYDAWKEGFPLEAWTVNMRQTSRIIPRENIVEQEKRDALVKTIREVHEDGANIILFNMRNPPGSVEIDNAVNPAWRKMLMFAIPFVRWNATDSEEYVTELSKKITFDWLQRFMELTPGSGTYMSESDYIQPNWQQAFHGDKYDRLYDIKQQWDPDAVFYAQNAVGMEDWEMGAMIMGHLPSQNSKLCRK